ncbi:hypothetical protein [Geminicoccus flavidas]|uniref:hypothetical protein n=1 Tax=Geminicoccus flavidas TaxID=2506407 RepID=UPI00190FB9F1|nr:hypothetical protein [Geminicoccus flavidas]
MDKVGGRTAKEERAARLAAAMRENLKRRKAQERARQERAQPAGGDAPERVEPGDGQHR